MSIQDKFTIIIPPQDIACNPDCIIRLANGDREAFAWVYKNYSKKIYDYALLLTGNDTISEDIVQEVFCKLWHHREKLINIDNFNGYLHALCRNYVMDILKGQQKETEVTKKYFHSTLTAVITPDEEFCNKEQHQILTTAVNKLPSQQKLVYQLRREQGLQRKEIADQLSISLFTVKNHIQKSLRFLKEYVLNNLEN